MSSSHCVFHKSELLTNFCRTPNCWLPLCPECVKVHLTEHTAKGTPPEIDTLSSVREETLEQLHDLKNAHDSTRKQLADLKSSVSANQNSSLSSLEQTRQQMLSSVNEFFDEIARDYTHKLQEKAKHEGKDLESLGNSLTEKSNQIENFIKKLENPNSFVKYLVMTQTSGLFPQAHGGLEEIHSRMAGLQRSEPEVRIDEAGLYSVKMDLARFVTICDAWEGGSLHGGSPGIGNGPFSPIGHIGHVPPPIGHIGHPQGMMPGPYHEGLVHHHSPPPQVFEGNHPIPPPPIVHQHHHGFEGHQIPPPPQHLTRSHAQPPMAFGNDVYIGREVSPPRGHHQLPIHPPPPHQHMSQSPPPFPQQLVSPLSPQNPNLSLNQNQMSPLRPSKVKHGQALSMIGSPSQHNGRHNGRVNSPVRGGIPNGIKLFSTPPQPSAFRSPLKVIGNSRAHQPSNYLDHQSGVPPSNNFVHFTQNTNQPQNSNSFANQNTNTEVGNNGWNNGWNNQQSNQHGKVDRISLMKKSKNIFSNSNSNNVNGNQHNLNDDLRKVI